MRLLGLLALGALLFAGTARGEPLHGALTLDQEQAARVVTVALGFMAPRILEPIPASQLAVWGLRGLTTLDPRLEARWLGGVIRLTLRDADGERLVAERPTPAEQDAAGWGALAAAMLRSGWDASRAVRQAGGAELVQTFFDELFNHLDPYSRYASPTETAEARAAWNGQAGVGSRAPETLRVERSGPLLLVRIAAFAADTGPRLARALASGVRPGVRGVVLDLRGNRGGVLAQAVAAAATLLPEGVVATTAGRDPAADRVFRAADEDLAYGLPVLVLVDGRSASAAEILAAALADQRRAVVIGSATVGKGLVQTIAGLPDGGSLYVTWSRVLAPLGWPLQGLGVLPQVCTALGADAALRQLRALAVGTQPMQAALARHRGSRAPIPAAEALEIRQACPAAEGREADLVAARFLIDHPRAYATALLGPPDPAAPP